MKREDGPLAKLLELVNRADKALQDSTAAASHGILAKQIEEHDAILKSVASRGRLGRSFAEVFSTLTALRALRATGRQVTTPDLHLIREVHLTLNGFPGLPPEPLPESIRTIDDEICHWDRVLQALNDLLASRVAQPDAEAVGQGIDGIQRDPQNCQRNAWLYEQRFAGRSNKQILNELNRIAPAEGWEPLASEQQIIQAADRHAEQQGVPKPLRRKAGRRNK